MIEIYTDGACSGNPGPGGWGVLLRAGNIEQELSGGEPATTNNRMELLAVIEALQAVTKPVKARVYTDSRYVQKGISEWIHEWKRRGWKTADKKPVKNEDLWRRLDSLVSGREIEWRWIKGHNGHRENERADALARAGLERARREGKSVANVLPVSGKRQEAGASAAHGSILDIRHARVYRGDVLVFTDLSFVLREGEHAVVLGPNGAGKSTLLKLLAGEVHPVPLPETSVRLFGDDRPNVWDVRKRLGIVSHDLQRDYLTCAKGLDVVLSGFYASNDTYDHQRFSDVQAARARDVMDELGLALLADRRFGHLSAGEQRRFLLGRALVHDPPVLVFDEPTSGLDLKACFQYLDLLRGQIRKGKTVLLVTHHLHEIPPEIDRVVLLKEGTIIADGAKSDLLTDRQISDLFDYPVKLIQADGWYQALPG
ncbi:MAG: ribonuclease HI [Nitrospira sp.]|nr:ribonuclease HI [Nitrospira sp.]MCP9461013.1 ribonuclease HI [Nitrospira sp.]MCP9475303.1 ribonuclease HI [Nitrospira sp.]